MGRVEIPCLGIGYVYVVQSESTFTKCRLKYITYNYQKVYCYAISSKSIIFAST